MTDSTDDSLVAPGEVTQLLAAIEAGQISADQLLPLVYRELKRLAAARMANERADHTLQPTALVHEVFLKLAEPDQLTIHDREHFLALSANAMRMVLADYSRRRGAQKRGGAAERVTLSAQADEREATIDLIALDECLTELKKLDERHAKIVELRFFSGMTVEEVASVLNCSRSTVEADWRMVRAWLQRALKDHSDS